MGCFFCIFVIMELTHKQELFCQEYMKTGNKSEAYRRAYDASNMSENSINVNASKMNNNAKVALRIKELQDEQKKRFEYTLEKSVKRDLNLIETYEAALEVLQNISSIDSEISAADRTIKYIGATGYSQAQDRLSKQLGFYEKDNKQKEVNVNLINLGKGSNPE